MMCKRFILTLLACLRFIAAAASHASAQTPAPGMGVDANEAAAVPPDPQSDFLSPDRLCAGSSRRKREEDDTVPNVDARFETAIDSRIPAFVSLHGRLPRGHQWSFLGTLESLMHKLGVFDRPGALPRDGVVGAGVDWLYQYTTYIRDSETVVASPHTLSGPETNHLILQLRRQGVEKLILRIGTTNLTFQLP